MNLQEATIKCLLENNELNILDKANEKLKNVKTSKELITLVDNYGNDKLGIGHPIYLIGKTSHWRLFDGEVIDDTKAKFLLSDGVSYRVVDVNKAYIYYKFSDKCR